MNPLSLGIYLAVKGFKPSPIDPDETREIRVEGTPAPALFSVTRRRGRRLALAE